MKFRKDFVTNSSSSSFVCEICGASESGWDISLCDAEMVQCQNGHTFCECEMIPPTRETMLRRIQEDVDLGHYFLDEEKTLDDYDDDDLLSMYLSLDDERYEIPEDCCPICQFKEYSNWDMARYLEKKYGVSRDEVFAAIKANNKRRRKLYDAEYITEVCLRFDLNPVVILTGLKDEFGSYANFAKFVCN